MPWFWARVHDRTQSLGYLRGGFQQLYDRMAECSPRGRAARRASAPRSHRYAQSDGGFLVETDAGDRALRPRHLDLRARG